MLDHNSSLFDLLSGEKRPIKNLGDTCIEEKTLRLQFNKIEKEAEKRFRKMFLGELDEITIEILEKTIKKMWNDGWNPQKGNINLFSTDFGAILTSHILKTLGGQLVFRSESNLIDSSIWWNNQKIEVFPFHKIYKRLSIIDSEDLEYFFDQISSIIDNKM